MKKEQTLEIINSLIKVNNNSQIVIDCLKAIKNDFIELFNENEKLKKEVK